MFQVTIKRDFSLNAAIHFSNEFFVNTYAMTAFMDIQTDSSREQQIAMERINYLFANELEHALFINRYNTEMIEKYTNISIRVCELLEDPFDQMIGMTILQKLNSILDDRIRVTEMTIKSRLGDDISYVLDADTVADSLKGNYWWNRSDLTIGDSDFEVDQNVIKLFVQNEWDMLKLSWKESD